MTLAIACISIGVLIAGPAWTYWLMAKNNAPNVQSLTILRELNDRMLRMLDAKASHESEMLNRLFSASSAMQSLGNQMIQKSLSVSAPQPGAGGLTQPPAPMRGPDSAFEEDGEDNVLVDEEDLRRAERAKADRLAELQEDGIETVPASHI